MLQKHNKFKAKWSQINFKIKNYLLTFKNKYFPEEKNIYFTRNNQINYIFIPVRRWVKNLIYLLFFIQSGFIIFLLSNEQIKIEVREVVSEIHILDDFIFKNPDKVFLKESDNIKHLYLDSVKIHSLSELSDLQLLEYSQKIVDLWRKTYKNKFKNKNNSVKNFLFNTDKIDVLQTSLIEQIKFNIPSSITIGQAIIETGWGRSTPGNNWFGIKGNSIHQKSTLEYFTQEELKIYSTIIVSKKQVGDLWLCEIIDNFQEFNNPWESFRAHSLKLFNSKRYEPLFKSGRNYSRWSDKIGSVHTGGLGYATDINYSKKLKKIIVDYKLYLLDN